MNYNKESQPEKYQITIKNLQNERSLEISFFDYKYNKLKEELKLELRRNISEKKMTYQFKLKDLLDNLRRLINPVSNLNFDNVQNTINNPNINAGIIGNYSLEPKLESTNSGLRAIKEENHIDEQNFSQMKNSCFLHDQLENINNDYLEVIDDMEFAGNLKKYTLNNEEEEYPLQLDQRKISSNQYRQNRIKTSKSSVDFSKKSISSLGRLSDEENLFAQ